MCQALRHNRQALTVMPNMENGISNNVNLSLQLPHCSARGLNLHPEQA